MPVILDDIMDEQTEQSPAGTGAAGGKKKKAPKPKIGKLYDPKYFNKNLTGSGKDAGVLCLLNNPVNIPPSATDLSDCTRPEKKSYTNGDTDVTVLPLDVITRDAYYYMDEILLMEKDRMAKVGNVTPAKSLWFGMEPFSLVLEESEDNSVPGTTGKKKRKLTVGYRMYLCSVDDAANPFPETARLLAQPQRFTNGKEPEVFTDISCNPKTAIRNLAVYAGVKSLDMQAFDAYVSNYSLYEGMCYRVKAWKKDANRIMDLLCKSIRKNHANQVGPLQEITRVIRKLDNYPVPLELYADIYDSIKSNFNNDTTIILCKQNVNLLLFNNMKSLNACKNTIQGIPAPDPSKPAPTVVIGKNVAPSPEQLAAITTTDPLVLVQSGAGTGKSSVILSRINYMKQLGIHPKDITVLSFTNAAANNIRNKCGEVNSMTIASMIHEIYKANFPKQELSTLDTIINVLDIKYNGNNLAEKLKIKLIDVLNTKSNAFIMLSNFVESNYSDVMTILDTIRQTSLELEIIICYLQIDTFVEPTAVQSKYLIIDEVQDNSLFEFAYAIKYVNKHKESLYIVGDCSQTLYEFRASNPKALNILEFSGTFKTYKLQVNYRSNQEILDFANVTLRNIEANQYARIQLKANSLKPVTADSFTTAVQMCYQQVAKLGDFDENLDSTYAVHVRPYVDACLAKGEKVAFLAHTRKKVAHIQEILAKLYPGKSIVSLVSEKGYNATIFSAFIKKYWDQISFAPTASITSIIQQNIMHNLQYLVYDANKMQGVAHRMISQWRAECQATINNWQRMMNAGRMGLDEFMDNVRDSMLSYEIRNNSIRQALLSTKNEEQKKAEVIAKADFIVSTIHGAKGLEFDNVVIDYRNENNMPEDNKRMYYVALTRAINSELIVAYDKLVYPKIVTDYEEIVETLAAKGTGNGTDAIDHNPLRAANQDVAKAQAFIKKKGITVQKLGELDKEKERQDESMGGAKPAQATTA